MKLILILTTLFSSYGYACSMTPGGINQQVIKEVMKQTDFKFEEIKLMGIIGNDGETIVAKETENGIICELRQYTFKIKSNCEFVLTNLETSPLDIEACQ